MAPTASPSSAQALPHTSGPVAADAPAEAPPGLSTFHIPPQRTSQPVQPATVTAFVGGSMLKVSVPRWSQGPDEDREKARAKRGLVSRFSTASRRRLMRTLASTQKKARPVFVTLTYPKVWPGIPELWKRHLENFCKRLIRRYPSAGIVWKLEFQRRGAPHYHLILWGVPDEGTSPAGEWEAFYNWVSLAWFQCVRSGDQKHLYAGTKCEAVRSSKGVMAYAAKYIGKQEVLSDMNVGRWWGVVNRENLPWAEEIPVEISAAAGFMLMRLMRRFARSPKARGNARYGLTIFCDGTGWARNLERLVYSVEGYPF